MDKKKVLDILQQAEHRMRHVNIGCFQGMDKPLFRVSDTYPGIWLEHLYDSVMYAKLFSGENEYIRNALQLFMDKQTEEGQFPCYVWNKAYFDDGVDVVGYGQIQECVSFGTVVLEAYTVLADGPLLAKCYQALQKWVIWLKNNRMTQGRGLVEMFCGYDTGHDNSGRLAGMACKGNYVQNGVLQNAKVLPPEDGITPIIAVDMNCNFYGNLRALSKMAEILGRIEESVHWQKEARAVKERLFAVCLDRHEAFFYDADRNGNHRKVKSSTIFHLFLEKVLDKTEDKTLIDEIYTRHLKNPDEFWTPFPLPSVAYNDPSTQPHEPFNSWGYFCQMTIYLRCTLWMDEYGWGKDMDTVCRKTVESWSKHFARNRLGQELDPVTGIPSLTSEWYSSCMLFYTYAVRRLKITETNVSLQDEA